MWSGRIATLLFLDLLEELSKFRVVEPADEHVPEASRHQRISSAWSVLILLAN